MAKFLRHIGKVGDRKVAVIFRELPGESHMCLIVYTELLNQNLHDPLMAAIEGDRAQQSKDLAEALNQAYTRDSKIILQVLHLEGMMKKMQTSQVVMTPGPGQTIRLNELNTILNEMEKGEDAVKRLAEMDASRGLQDPIDVARRMRGDVQPLAGNQNSALDDDSIAQNLLRQAAKMTAEAQGLLAESARLEQEAKSLMPEPVAEQPTKKKPGRQKKTVALG